MSRILFLLLLFECGTLISGHSGQCKGCSMYQYCKSGNNGCGECSDVCESSNPDYNWDLCKEECFDYLRDFTHTYGTIQDHKDTIGKIYTLAIVITILLVLLVLMVGGIVFRKVYRYTVRKLRKLERKNYKEKQLSAVQYSITNNNNIRERDGNGSQSLSNMRNTMPSTITLTTQPESSPTYTNSSATKTLPLSSEEPSEDTTLDYASYVNQGMSHSQSKETDLNTTPKY